MQVLFQSEDRKLIYFSKYSEVQTEQYIKYFLSFLSYVKKR